MVYDADTPNKHEIVTYILLTKSSEIYCGKTINLKKRLEQHKKLNKKSWFNKSDRCDFITASVIFGDYKKQIKRAGVKLIFNIIRNINRGVSAS